MLAGKNAEIYEKLWRKNSLFEQPRPENPVAITYLRFHRMPDGQAAYFATGLDGRAFPHIRIGRDPVPAECSKADLGAATILELISLAHERGHEQSWRDGTYAPNTMAEEHRAWDAARSMLHDLDFEDWDEFEEAKRVSLEEHRRRGTSAE